jgi:hypothetical protein
MPSLAVAAAPSAGDGFEAGSQRSERTRFNKSSYNWFCCCTNRLKEGGTEGQALTTSDERVG